MKLAEMSWPAVAELSRDVVVLIPTGSFEQHGPHLSLITDTLIVNKVAEACETALSGRILLTPPIWQGASAHHLAFPGTISASMAGYMASVAAVVDSLAPHGFRKFYVVNGHGGNDEPNGVVMRELKARYPNVLFAYTGYWAFAEESFATVLEGPTKTMMHADEAETSLMLYLAPYDVDRSKFRADGLRPEPSVRGVVHAFDELTERGVLGDPTLASAEKGVAIFRAVVAGLVTDLTAFADGYVLRGI